MLLEWVSRAQGAGLRPRIYCRGGWELADLVRTYGLPCEEAGYVAHRSGLLRLARWHNFIRTWRIAARERRNGTPVLLAPGTVQASLLHILACRLAGATLACYVPMAHDAAVQRASFPCLRDFAAARLGAMVALWITISPEQQRLLQECWKFRAPILLIPNRLALLDRPPSTRSADCKSQEILRVIYAGRFDANQKGLDWLAGVLASGPKWSKGMEFLFQGRGDFSARLETLAREAGADRIRVLPWGSIAEMLNQVEVLLLPSRFEGVPLVAIEAIWQGVPVVASLESGLGLFLPEACLFSFGDAEALGRALERMRSAPQRDAAVAYARARMADELGESRYEAALGAATAAFRELAAPADREVTV